jgi:hypothetical protein
MTTLRYLLISFSWLPIITLAAWWAGFMPFPTRPAEVGLQGYTFDGIGGSGKESRSLIRAATAKEKGKAAPYGLGQWYCGDDQKQGADPDPKHCHIYEVREEPFFGWVSPSWLLTVNTTSGGATPVAFYGTYAACKWTEEHKQKADEDNRVNYERWATEQHQKIDPQGYEFYDCVRAPGVAPLVRTDFSSR